MSRLARYALWVALAAIFVSIQVQSWNGARSLVHSQRTVCTKAFVGRAANASAWYAAYQARLATGLSEPKGSKLRRIDLGAANTYFNTAWDYNYLGEVGHGLYVGGRYPLGQGTTDCVQEYPEPSLIP